MAFRPLVASAFVLLALSVAGCDGCGRTPIGDGGDVGDPCAADTPCRADLVCGDDGLCAAPPPGADGGVPDAGVNPDAGSPFVDPVPVDTPDPDDGQNAAQDADCDGISDQQEYGDLYAGDRKTDPAEWDTDGDGISDGVESGHALVIDLRCAFTTLDADPATHSDPTNADSDNDGIPDGVEDTNKNGRVDPGETDPRDLDSDDDGLSDGEEDANHNGRVDGDEPDPQDPDSDGDGLTDGSEVDLGLDPNQVDSDGDGIDDAAELEAGSDPGNVEPDSDNDGISDAREAVNGTSSTSPDSDGDGLCDGPLTIRDVCQGGEDKNGDGAIGVDESDPRSADTDCDALSDREERTAGTDALDDDTDGDGLGDGLERGKTASPDAACAGRFTPDADPATTTNALVRDTDADGRNDGVEDLNRDGKLAAAAPGQRQETDPLLADTDGDGLCDGALAVGTCVAGEDLDNDGVTQPAESDPRERDVDTDLDGMTDAKERAAGTSATVADTDGDGLCDGPRDVTGVCTGGEDQNGNGLKDADETSPVEPDTDCDGVSDGEEVTLVLNARNRDSDGDGITDGIELGRATAITGTRCASVARDANTAAATNSNPRKRDTDADGIPDGAEDRNRNGDIAGVTASPRETFPSNADSDGDGLCDGPLTVPGVCRAGEDLDFDGLVDPGESDPRAANIDADKDGLEATVEARLGTSDASADTDGDGLCDGPLTVAASSCVLGEDKNGNGRVDTGETSPTSKDTDCDGLADLAERTDGTNPLLVDTDGDLLADGVERGVIAAITGTFGCAQAPLDTDASTKTDPTKLDSDGDGINDGTEDRDHDGKLDPPNASGVQETNAAVADTDSDGLCDGPATVGTCVAGEDTNRNGRVDASETDPRVANVDTDGDGLSDNDETTIYGTSPTNADTDGDDIPDGEELREWRTDPTLVDSDCDGVDDGAEVAASLEPNDADSDDDGLTDGLELGTTCRTAQPNPQTDVVCGARCIADADPTTTTSPSDADSDSDGVLDGSEDANQNGKRDADAVPPELDPNNAGDVSGADIAACSAQNLRTVTFVSRGGDKADLTLAVDPTIPQANIKTLVVSGDERGAVFLDANKQLAGAAFKLVSGVTGADAAEQLVDLESKFALVGTRSERLTRTFTTWDDGEAVRATYTYADTGNDTVGKALTDIIGATLPGVGATLTGTLAGTEKGPFRLQLELVRRSATSTVVVVALTNLATFNANEPRLFSLDDQTNGTALAQFGDATGVQCDRFAVEGAQKVDFIWVIDNSSSMREEQDSVRAATAAMGTQLASSTVDYRIAVLTTDLDLLPNDGPTWDKCDFPQPNDAQGNRVQCPRQSVKEFASLGGGNLTEGSTRPRYCPFTSSLDTFNACIASLDPKEAAGSGGEVPFRQLACVVGRTVAGKAQCGRASKFGPYTTAIYQEPPSVFKMLPATAEADPANPNKLRSGAQVVVIFLTDTLEQTDGSGAGDVNTNLTAWEGFFANIDGNGTRAFVAGIVCPNGGQCGDGTQTARWTTFLNDMQGIEAELPRPEDPLLTSKIQNAVADILRASIANASPNILTKPPISATIKLATDAVVIRAAGCGTQCDATGCRDIPRSRVHGYDFDGITNSIQLFGDCRPLANQTGKRLTASYRYWIENSPSADGNPDPCEDCAAPFLCQNQQCLCPTDCGLDDPLQPGQTCDAATCAPVCLADCGGCGSGEVCDTTTCTCACPADCGGAPPVPGMVCDNGPGGTCEYLCEDCALTGPKPSAFSLCNHQTCEWECNGCGGDDAPPGKFCNNNPAVCAFACEADCGGCGAGLACNTTSCACECPADCGGSPPREGMTCNRATCQFECPTPPVGSTPPGPAFAWDPTTCSYQCPADCGGGLHGPEAVCDTATCTFECPADCGGCDGATVCDAAVCACACPTDCGRPSPGAGYTCNTTTCAYECTTTPDEATRPGANFTWNADTCAWECPETCGEDAAPTSPYRCDASTCTAVCRPDCGGCGALETCDTASCACTCDTTATCAAGFVFDTESCGCVCDAARDCGPTRELDPETCACTCKEDANGNPDCGGCAGGTFCQPSLCACQDIPG